MRESIQVPHPKGLKKMRLWALLIFLAAAMALPLNTRAQSAEAPSGNVQSQPGAVAEPGQEPGTVMPTEGSPTAVSLPDATAVKTVREALLRENFTYAPRNLLDPFIAFIAPADSTPPMIASDDEDMGPPPEPQRPLTPLQKMKISEIEKGLKAITWGDLGRRAIIEDAAGKGYIVGVGTPVGEKNGVVTEIFNDSLVIQQEYWDKKAKRMIPQNFVVKLVKVNK